MLIAHKPEVVYLIENREENARLMHENVKVLGDIAILYGHPKLRLKIFSANLCLSDQTAPVIQTKIPDLTRH